MQGRTLETCRCSADNFDISGSRGLIRLMHPWPQWVFQISRIIDPAWSPTKMEPFFSPVRLWLYMTHASFLDQGSIFVPDEFPFPKYVIVPWRVTNAFWTYLFSMGWVWLRPVAFQTDTRFYAAQLMEGLQDRVSDGNWWLGICIPRTLTNVRVILPTGVSLLYQGV